MKNLKKKKKTRLEFIKIGEPQAIYFLLTANIE